MPDFKRYTCAIDDSDMRLLCWNILHGGGRRVGQITYVITSHNPDVIALTEFRRKPGAHIREDLKGKGWTYAHFTEVAGTGNGICVLSRTPMQVSETFPDFPARCAGLIFICRWLVL